MMVITSFKGLTKLFNFPFVHCFKKLKSCKRHGTWKVTDSAGVFIDAQPIAVVQSRDGHIRLEGVGNEFAVGNVIAEDRILDVATERVELGAQFLADALERLVGRSE